MQSSFEYLNIKYKYYELNFSMLLQTVINKICLSYCCLRVKFLLSIRVYQCCYIYIYSWYLCILLYSYNITDDDILIG